MINRKLPPMHYILRSITLLAALGATNIAQAQVAPVQGVQADDHVYTSDLITQWGKTVTPDNVWQSYPRPQMQRRQWLNLNGLWDYAITAPAIVRPDKMDGQILVPFPVESKLSRVARKLTPDQRLWYRRPFAVPLSWAGQRIMLNFGAVDYIAQIWVNGAPVGGHRGGFDAFALDVTDYLKSGQNELVVQVSDPNSTGDQPRGKQALEPGSIWYTAVSGIWQTVWLEPVPKLHIADVRATPDIDRGVIDVDVALNGGASDTDAVRLTASTGGKTIASTILRGNRHATLAIPNVHLWSPDDPFLYDLKAELVTVGDPYAGLKDRDQAAYDARFTWGEGARYAATKTVGTVRDTVDGYFAMRKISVGPGTIEGQPALLLNNRLVFHNGTLDQGWWPDGLYTPPSEEAMKSDLIFLKKAGFNMVRKHIKVEPARYYYDADHLGMLIWQDMPSGGSDDQYVSGTSQGQAVMSGTQMADHVSELSRMVAGLRAFPSIVLWVINNEGWGQFDSKSLAQYVRNIDPSRLVDADSGWLDVAPGVSDIFDIHTYEDQPKVPTRQSNRAIVIGEYGGVGLSVDGHIWRPGKKNWGYQVGRDDADYLARYRRKMEEVVRQAREHGLSASVYTQTTDVEDEINGLLTYDRARSKASAEDLAKIAAPLHNSTGR